MIPLSLLALRNTPILEQLRIEEALLRTDERNVCIVNYGSPRAIVMGLSGVPEELLHLESVRQDRIPVIKRFSGGGTVIVDESTLFISFLMNKSALAIDPYPEPILRWSADLYRSAWNLPDFSLSENDYTLGERKCGGNAQYLRKDRWLHHTSFLFDFCEENMDYLLLPKKRPVYRKDRAHSDFLCRLKERSVSIPTLIEQLKNRLVKQFDIEEISSKDLVARPHRQATHLVEI